MTNVQFPALALIVSGGHTELLLMRGWGKYECVGATRDDAAGEAFDKVGKLLGLPYPGGPAVAKAAASGDPKAFDFPRGMVNSGDYDFSFSGLKTAVRYLVEGWKVESGEWRVDRKRSTAKHRPLSTAHHQLVRDVCASFQQAVVDVLVAKTIAAAQRYRAKTILLGGGVAANVELRRQLSLAVQNELAACSLQLAAPRFCGDNAAMIAAAGGIRLLLGERTPWQQLDVDANWELGR
jgi:N6-L-threonylcarbamoyladenine synthase